MERLRLLRGRRPQLLAEQRAEPLVHRQGLGAALFGRAFDYVPEPNRYGLPAFYALHAWIWKPNPSGLFHAWNPKVACDGS